MDLDPNEIQVGIAAAKVAAARITYMGVSVGSHITDDEYYSVVVAVIAAVEGYRSGTTI